ncbi:unnamed protein product [Rhodiola kirilowii]
MVAASANSFNQVLISKAELALSDYVLNLLGSFNHLRQLKKLQSYLITLGHGQKQFYAFKLVRFCTLTLANLGYARRIFDYLQSPNIYLYTAMITAYASSVSNQRDAVSLYREMVRRGEPRPNHFVFPHVLRCGERDSEWICTRFVHGQILRSGFGEYSVVQTALADSYLRFWSDVEVARKLFDEMSDRNVVSWTAMISGYMRLGQIGNAILLFEKMPERDVPSWNSIISGCTQNGLFSEAISLIKRMVIAAESEEIKLKNSRPNQITVACALSACSHTGMLQLGKGIHAYTYRNNLVHDVYISNALVDMYGKCGSLKVARSVFDTTRNRSLMSWNSMINAYALHGQSANAINLFEEMILQKDYIIPDGVTFVGLLNACTHGGLVEQGWSYFDMMTVDYRIEPRIEHYGCLIDLLGRTGRFNEAMEVISNMSFPPDEVVWSSLLNGCKIHGQADLAEFAVKKLLEFDPENGGYGIMLANLYSELGKWDDVRKSQEDTHPHDVVYWPNGTGVLKEKSSSWNQEKLEVVICLNYRNGGSREDESNKASQLSHLRLRPTLLTSCRGVVSKLFVELVNGTFFGIMIMALLYLNLDFVWLSVYTTENGLTEAFSQFGQVVEAKIVMDKLTGKSKNFGFVTFASGDEAEKAVREMNEKELNGRTIYVDYAKPKTEFGSTGMPIARRPP